MSVYAGPELTDSNLVLGLDAGNGKSYPGSGSTFTDLSGNSNNGTLISSPTFSSANGGSLTFNGSTNWVNCGNAANLQLYTGTIAAWIKASSSGNSSYRGIIVKQNAWALFVFSNELITYSWNIYGAQGTGRTVGDNTWHHVALTFTSTDVGAAGNATIYLDGTSVGTARISHLNHNIPVTLASGTNGASQILNGDIAHALVYNRVLTQAELLQNYYAQRGRFGL
jgi:hypothetical protein